MKFGGVFLIGKADDRGQHVTRINTARCNDRLEFGFCTFRPSQTCFAQGLSQRGVSALKRRAEIRFAQSDFRLWHEGAMRCGGSGVALKDDVITGNTCEDAKY